MTIKPKVQQLIDRGVAVPVPQSVEIDSEVDAERISGDGVVIHAGCKLLGKSLWIGAGCRLGAEAPVTVDNCRLGKNVELKGGFFKNAVFLEGAAAGSGTHVREGTIFEEGASIAHTVGLKQTILFPFVTLGSLINFCDVLMAGGTDRKNHSEVGSSYIHFNYTPNQDKATASLLGDVPRGVMLKEAPIFMGGQGGLVGPCRLEYGTVLAAGTIQRKDELRAGRLLIGGGLKEMNLPFKPGTFRGDKRIVNHNLTYIANLAALGQWYRHVRAMFVSEDGFARPLLEGLSETLQSALKERVKRLGQLAEKMERSGTARAKELAGSWSKLETLFTSLEERGGDRKLRDEFLKKADAVRTERGNDYLAAIKGLDADTAELGTRWLQGIVDAVREEALEIVPAFR